VRAESGPMRRVHGFQGERGFYLGQAKEGCLYENTVGWEGWRGGFLDGGGVTTSMGRPQMMRTRKSRSDGSASTKGGERRKPRSSRPWFDSGHHHHFSSSPYHLTHTPQRNSRRKRESGKPHLGIECQKRLYSQTAPPRVPLGQSDTEARSCAERQHAIRVVTKMVLRHSR
jgi:hypothetical protein